MQWEGHCEVARKREGKERETKMREGQRRSVGGGRVTVCLKEMHRAYIHWDREGERREGKGGEGAIRERERASIS